MSDRTGGSLTLLRPGARPVRLSQDRPVILVVDDEKEGVERLMALLTLAGVNVIYAEHFRTDQEGEILRESAHLIDLVQVDLLIGDRTLNIDDVAAIGEVVKGARTAILSQHLDNWDDEPIEKMRRMHDYVLNKGMAETTRLFGEFHHALRSLRLRQLDRFEEGLMANDLSQLEMARNRLGHGLVTHDSTLPPDVVHSYELLRNASSSDIPTELDELRAYEDASPAILSNRFEPVDAIQATIRTGSQRFGKLILSIDWTVALNNEVDLSIEYSPPSRIGRTGGKLVITPVGLRVLGDPFRRISDGSRSSRWDIPLVATSPGVGQVQADLFLGSSWLASAHVGTFVYTA